MPASLLRYVRGLRSALCRQLQALHQWLAAHTRCNPHFAAFFWVLYRCRRRSGPPQARPWVTSMMNKTRAAWPMPGPQGHPERRHVPRKVLWNVLPLSSKKKRGGD